MSALKQALDHHRQGRLGEAEAGYRDLLRLEPGQPDALQMLGVLLAQTGRAAEGVQRIEQSLAIRPANPAAHHARGSILSSLGRRSEAIACYRRALELGSALPETHYNLGLMLALEGRFDEALAAYEGGLALAPRHAGAHTGRGEILLDRGRVSEALEALEAALRVEPSQWKALFLRGRALAQSARPAEAAVSFRRAQEINPDGEYLLGARLWADLHAALWSEYEPLVARIEADVAHGKPAAFPFMLFSACDSPELQLECARQFAARYRPETKPLWRRERYTHDRIRVAYLSEDFRIHPTSHLMLELWELHDRRRFEITAISLRPAEDSAVGRRAQAAFDRFVDASALPDAAIAERMRDLEIDIAVDLMGYTGGALRSILARRPAPVQVNYLGYPGTLGSRDVDYLIADEFLIPKAHRAFFTEQIVYLPDTYQPNDRRRALSALPSRAAAGLPADSFVWCSFNNTYKLTPRLFDIWARLLEAVPGSVLWLIRGAPEAEGNLRNAIAARRIDPARLVFAPTVANPEHLARIHLADLCLDTAPVSGATTTSDALWAGVPVVTCAGRSFVARMAGSILTGAGLPELITTDWGGYEELALSLARDPERLSRLRAKLRDGKPVSALFDTDRMRRNLESAYLTMYERQRRGELPASFAVEP